MKRSCHHQSVDLHHPASKRTTTTNRQQVTHQSPREQHTHTHTHTHSKRAAHTHTHTHTHLQSFKIHSTHSCVALYTSRKAAHLMTCVCVCKCVSEREKRDRKKKGIGRQE